MKCDFPPNKTVSIALADKITALGHLPVDRIVFTLGCSYNDVRWVLNPVPRKPTVVQYCPRCSREIDGSIEQTKCGCGWPT